MPAQRIVIFWQLWTLTLYQNNETNIEWSSAESIRKLKWKKSLVKNKKLFILITLNYYLSYCKNVEYIFSNLYYKFIISLIKFIRMNIKNIINLKMTYGIYLYCEDDNIRFSSFKNY